MQYFYRPQRSCGQGYVFTRVCDSVNRGGAIAACIAGGIPACLAAGLRGVPPPRGGRVPGPGGVACSWGAEGAWSKGGVCSWGRRGCVAFCYGLLLWASGMAFWYGLLVRPSGTGGSLPTDPFQPEGHNRKPYQNGLLVWPSGKAFWCDLLLWPSGVVAFCYGLLVERGGLC